VTRAALAAAVAATIAATAHALPLPPSHFQIVPVYSATRAIHISWTERGGVKTWNIRRRVDHGPEALVKTFPGGAAGHHLSYTDHAVSEASEYTYRVEVCDAATCIDVPDFTTSVRVVWPISGGHRVLHGFNEPVAWAGWNGEDGKAAGFHDGIDLGRTSTGDEPADDVHAARGGIVHEVYVRPPPAVDDVFVQIQVDVGGGHFEFDGYHQISTETPLAVTKGQFVAPGQRLGVMGTRVFTPGLAFDDHVHFQLGASGTSRTTVRNPLTIFTHPNDRDPLGNPPALNDENGDGKTALYRTHGTGALLATGPTDQGLHGDVDVAAEITDIQGTEPHQAPIALGYWIEGPLPESEHKDDVKSATHPYKLYDFHTAYWGARPETACDLVSDLDDVANFGCRGVKPVGCIVRPSVPCNSTLKEDGTAYLFPILHHFIVTHAAAETGARNGLNRNQFWRTAAKDDNGVVTSTHANYAGQPTTTRAWEARFPDGDYTIHLVASDLQHPNVDVPLPRVRLENFAPFLTAVLVAKDADHNPATGLPETPGCEEVAYDYKHPARRQYPDPVQLAAARGAAGFRPVPAGTTLCVRLRFSEPMSMCDVDLAGDRGIGAVLGPVVGGFVKTHADNDTWRGTITLPPDPSGNSDSSIANDEKDVAVRVRAADRPFGNNDLRGLDRDGDGFPNAAPDGNHLLKVDLSPPKRRQQVTK
jgi:hypothetical protein